MVEQPRMTLRLYGNQRDYQSLKMEDEGWRHLEDGCSVEGGECTLELFNYLAEGEDLISYEVLRARSLERGGGAGQSYAEQLQHLEQGTIPKEWRQFVLVFSDSLWCDPDGLLFIQCLVFFSGEWLLQLAYADGGRAGWNERGRAVHICH